MSLISLKAGEHLLPTEDIGKTLEIVSVWTTYQGGITAPIQEQTNIDIEYINGSVISARRKVPTQDR
mgnify:CR=1 FL=1